MAFTRPEPLRGKHSLEGFSCGQPSLDSWLLRYARRAEADGTARTYVTTEDEVQVVGYYSLAAGSVAPEDATRRLLAGQPAVRPVPIVLLARLAVAETHQGQGLGISLLQNAMLRSIAGAKQLGARALVVHALDENARAWYLRYGFEVSPTDRLHLILLMKDLRKFLGEVGALSDEDGEEGG